MSGLLQIIRESVYRLEAAKSDLDEFEIQRIYILLIVLYKFDFHFYEHVESWLLNEFRQY
jgi:hypothetical protein